MIQIFAKIWRKCLQNMKYFHVTYTGISTLYILSLIKLLKTYYDITEQTNTRIVVRLSPLSELEDSVGWS